jgi:hypothetical protein
MLTPLSYHLPALHGSVGERAALLDDIKQRGLLEAHDLNAFVDAVSAALEDAAVRVQEAEEEARSAPLAFVEEKITNAFDELVMQHPQIADELRDACLGLILEVR